MARKTVRKGRKRGGSPGTLAQLVSSQTGGTKKRGRKVKGGAKSCNQYRFYSNAANAGIECPNLTD